MTSPPPSTASRELVRRLFERERAGVAGPAAAGAAMQRVCTRMSDNLRRSVGDDGYNALIARAFRRVESSYPALQDRRRTTDSGIHLDGLVASIDEHGQEAVTIAIESLLAALADILSSLIGADMVLNLLDAPSQTPDRGHRS